GAIRPANTPTRHFGATQMDALHGPRMNINLDEGLRARHGDDAEAADLEGYDVIRHIAPAMKVRAQGGVHQIDDIAQNAVRVHIVDFKGTIVASGERCAAPRRAEVKRISCASPARCRS